MEHINSAIRTRSNTQKAQSRSANPWSQHPFKQAFQKPANRANNMVAAIPVTQVPVVKSGKPIYQPDVGSTRKQDPFAGVVMERVSAPFRPSTPLSVAPSTTNSSRQQTARFLSPPGANSHSSGQAKKKSRSPNAYDPRLDRPYRQEHPIWKMLNWESTRM